MTDSNTAQEYAIGIDIGSTASKVAVFSGSQLIELFVRPTGFSSVEVAKSVMADLASRGIEASSGRIVATGYGRNSVGSADKAITEISCHAKGAAWLFKEDGVVIDIGGQDTKLIEHEQAKVLRFLMNDKCSAGTGKFLEVMADRMALSQTELAEIARKGKEVTISSLCTVFAESEVISLIGEGVPREDIACGVLNSVASKVASFASQMPSTRYFLTGGLCENTYILDKLSSLLGGSLRSCSQARYAGAIGAALLASEGEASHV